MVPVIDAHQHFWNLEQVSYPWIPADSPLLRSFEPVDLLPELRDAGVDATVLVQAADSYEDTDYMLDIADSRPFVAGVVGWVPLLRPKEAEEALDRFGQRRVFKGVRHLIHDEPDPDWLLQEPVLEGLRLVAERGMTLDVPAELPRHLEHVATLAERLPELTIVVDHLGKPPIREKGWEPWATVLARAAERPNVYAKLSGLDTAADRQNWTAEDLRPYVHHALRCFGAERLMFGSDWPVSTLAGGYGKVWREMSRLFGELGEPERRAILGETAIAVYRLEWRGHYGTD